MARILVVDDDPLQRQIVCGLLAAAGHEASDCGDSTKAIALLETVKPDLAIFDYDMPGLTGTELLSQLRARDGGGRLPVIFLSGTDAIRFSAQVAPSPHTRFLQKPVDGKVLAKAIADLLDPEGWSAQS